MRANTWRRRREAVGVKAEHVLLVGFIAVLTAFAASTFVMVRFYLRLKRHEYDTWVLLGSPMPTFDRSKAFDDFAQTRRFLKSGGHRSFRDEKSSRLGDLVMLTDRILIALAVLVSVVTGYIVAFVKP
jgi:hypothetical protein